MAAPVRNLEAGDPIGRAFFANLVGVIWRPPPPTRRLPDGTIGYGTRPGRKDDCFAAALASCLQVPIEEVPDPRIDERLAAGASAEEINADAWCDLQRWLAGRGLRMIVHRTIPANRSRWIGVIGFSGAFQSHCVVMTFDRVLFEPGSNARTFAFGAESITYGLSFNKRKE